MHSMSYEDAVSASRFRHKPQRKFDFLVFIGRFQPLHLGHLDVIRHAMEQADQVIVLVGSSNAPRSHRNPWTFDERARMIRGALCEADCKRLLMRPIEDRAYNNAMWVRQVQEAVDHAIEDSHDFATTPRTGLIGHNKDNTSYYLKLFPQWEAINVEGFNDLAATRMREGVFSNICESYLHGSADLLPPNVVAQLAEFAQSPEYVAILEEYEFIRGYRQLWAAAPYLPTFVTTDAVVVQGGHVLLVRRGEKPGKGQLALPGGYLRPDQTIEDSMIRELREETRIKVPDPILRGSIVEGPRIFDDPHRDPRGRFITNVYLINLEPRAERGFRLPHVKGSDDADFAAWVPLSEVKRKTMFLDHYDIILNMTARL